MGIKGLTQLINDEAPKAIKQYEMKAMFGRKIAVDASMSIYQFLIAVRQQDGQQLQTESGDATSHLLGLFHRTIRMCENGIKPLYVFDGKPPQLKSGVLAKRFARRDEAKDEGEEAKETGTVEDMDRASRRTVRVTREHNEECRRLLKLMGIPYIDAPSEAEAQCAELCRGGVVYAAGSEDMDTLTFGSPVLLRHLTFSEARKLPIDEIKLSDVLSGLDMDMNTFIDFCILCGCDYLEPLKKMGAKTAFNSIKKHDNLEGVLEYLRTHTTKKKDGTVSGNPPPEDWPYEEARELFRKPDVLPAKECNPEWKEPDLDGLIQFLVQEKGFSEDRVRKGAEKLRHAVTAKQQGRLDGFFKAAPTASSSSVNPARAKRLAEEAKEKEEKKKAKKAAKSQTKKSKKKADSEE